MGRKGGCRNGLDLKYSKQGGSFGQNAFRQSSSNACHDTENNRMVSVTNFSWLFHNVIFSQCHFYEILFLFCALKTCADTDKRVEKTRQMLQNTFILTWTRQTVAKTVNTRTAFIFLREQSVKMISKKLRRLRVCVNR